MKRKSKNKKKRKESFLGREIVKDVSKEFLNKKARRYWVNILKTIWHHSERDKPRGLFDFLKSSYKDSRKKQFGGHVPLIGAIPLGVNNPEDPDEVERQIQREIEQLRILREIEQLRIRRRRQREEHEEIMRRIQEEHEEIMRGLQDEHTRRMERMNKEKFGKKKIKRNSIMKKEKISLTLKKMCKKHKVRLTVKRNGKRVYKSVKVLKKQCANKKKKKSKRKFGAARKMGYVRPASSSLFGNVQPFGYTVGKPLRFGSRRPHKHPLRYAFYNPAKTDKVFRK
tara:strand:+ start:73 stop:921 length:849 start_codon:yes stop_codon:yes gene_type:complete